MSHSGKTPAKPRRPLSTAVAVIWVSALLLIAIFLMSFIAVQWWA